ncbi:hypothetical protein GCM10027589_04220 [Actinocorallia lasiicapitis]
MPRPPISVGDVTEHEPQHSRTMGGEFRLWWDCLECQETHLTTVACPDCGATVLYTLTWDDGDDHLQGWCLCGTTWTTPITPHMWDTAEIREETPDHPPE